MSKEIIYIDMDGVLVDLRNNIDKWFQAHPKLINKYKDFPDHIPGIFRDPPPIENSIESVFRIDESKKFQLFIATSSPWGNPGAATDKRYWIEKYFGNLFHKRMFITHRKDLLMGHYLIDDRLKNGAENFQGKLLSFGWSYEQQKFNEFPNWEKVTDLLIG